MKNILRVFATIFFSVLWGSSGFAGTTILTTHTIKVEIAWLTDTAKATAHTHKPNQCEINAVVSVFATNGWTVQIEWGDEITETDINKTIDFSSKTNTFDSNAGTWHDLEVAHRHHAENSGWHFVLFGHNQSGDGVFTTSSGRAELPGDEFIVTLGSFENQVGTPWDRAATFMHELGHNLGLHHSGDQDESVVGQYKPNYASIMTYRYQLLGVKSGMQCQGLAIGVPTLKNLDYSHGTLTQIDENALVEANGIGYGGVDWDCSGKICGTVSQDVHDRGSGTFFTNWCGNSGIKTLLNDYDDWGHITDIASPAPAGVEFNQEVVSCATFETLNQFNCAYPGSQPDPCAAEPTSPPPSLDVVFIMDVTGSTGDLLPQWKAAMPGVVARIQSKFPQARFGLASHLDFPFDDHSLTGEYAYRLESPLDSNLAPMLTALSNLTNGDGLDEPESQYEAIYQALTGSGRDLYGDGSFSDQGDIQPCSMNYLPGNRIIIVHFTWPPLFHDRDLEPDYPFPGSQPVAGRTLTIATLLEKHATYFGLANISSTISNATSRQSGKKISPQNFSMLASNQMQELADTTGGVVLYAGGDLSGLSTAIDSVVKTIETNVSYRTISAESLALAVDAKGKLQAVKPKADKDEFCVKLEDTISAPVNGLHIEFSEKLLTGTFSTTPSETSAVADVKGQKWDIKFASSIDSGMVVTVCGFGDKGQLQKVSKFWWVFNGSRVGRIQKDAFFTKNLPRLPMPNLHNLGEELFARGGFPGGLKIGLGGPHSVVLTSYNDVQKSLIKQHGKLFILDTLGPRCLDSTDHPHEPILKQLKNLPPDKQNNKLFAEQVAFKIAIAASQMRMIPIGLGELTYNDGTVDPLNGETLDSIVAQCDSFLTLCAVQNPLLNAEVFDSTIHKINTAFSGNVDTISFADSLVLKGVRLLSSAPFLHASGIVPKTIHTIRGYTNETPRVFKLYQNYPNPFNPTTKIEFDLPQPSVVTLKVYNVLGQEVRTLLDHQARKDGVQRVEFNAGNLASGVYFYRIIAEGTVKSGKQSFTDIKKMMLIK